MKLFSRCALLALLVVTASLAVAGPAAATITSGGNATVTLTLATGTSATLNGSFAGVKLIVSCTTFSVSGTVGPGDSVTGSPTWAGCSGTLGGAAVTCTITSVAGWSLTSVAGGGPTSFNVSAAIKAVGFKCNKAAGGTCTITIPAQTVATGIVWTNAAPGTLTATAAPVKSISMLSDCIGVAVSGVTGSFSAQWSSSLNTKVTLS
jgi:hypothetical protein